MNTQSLPPMRGYQYTSISDNSTSKMLVRASLAVYGTLFVAALAAKIAGRKWAGLARLETATGRTMAITGGAFVLTLLVRHLIKQRDNTLDHLADNIVPHLSHRVTEGLSLTTYSIRIHATFDGTQCTWQEAKHNQEHEPVAAVANKILADRVRLLSQVSKHVKSSDCTISTNVVFQRTDRAIEYVGCLDKVSRNDTTQWWNEFTIAKGDLQESTEWNPTICGPQQEQVVNEHGSWRIIGNVG